ncbi:hypothetical protein [Pseudofrankia inefficax]|uniref:Uncharacterized protein n=1 Tax=Pseudofrankia inefficax (strain DSM 45817 / CECT 9037 / DDB 130130 / EuI1c) TaxID=298654 RepID=E3J173_PSEI1|nr:hypothetical protein [Pseudofrankia inefficax]ADP79251.1 hypothetical protein FraEuI1c_1179 [Pseudofrankia inefficax]
MARTRAAGHDSAYRAVPGDDLPGTPGRSSRDGGPRHLFGIVAVAAVFALVGLTLWRPLSALVAVPLIAVLALIVRRAVPVPAAAKAAGASARRPARDGQATTATSRAVPPSRGVPARRPATASRYGDRPPYDQEAERPTTAVRRPTPPPGRYRPDDDRYGRDDARGRRDEQAPRPRRAATPPPGFDGDPAYVDPRRVDPGRVDPRRAAARHHADDQARAFPGDAARSAREPRPGYPDDRYPAAPDVAQPAARHPRDPAGDRYTGTGPGGLPAGGTGPGARRHAEAGYGEVGYGDETYVGGERPAAYQRGPADEYPDQRSSYPAQPRQAEYDDFDGYEDEYDGEGDGHEADVDDSGAETRRWRGWRRPDWDDDGEPEPEPNEDMMHTMALDMRGYLDDTGSFRMP